MAVNFDKLMGLPEIKALCAELGGGYSFNFQQVAEIHWGCHVEGSVINIAYSDDRCASCCLAHELLHAWLQHRGYRRLCRGITSFDDTGWFGQSFLTAIDNELQHHRMFQRYLQTRYDGRWFYGGNPDGIREDLNKKLARGDIKSIVVGYISLIALGGQLLDKEKKEFHEKFSKRSNGKYAPLLKEVDESFAAWRVLPDNDMNAEPTVRRIMLALQNPTLTWISYSRTSKFPEDGFFIGDAFEAAE